MIETQYKKEKDALIEKYEAEILILKNIIEDRALARPITPAIYYTFRLEFYKGKRTLHLHWRNKNNRTGKEPGL